MRLFLSWSGELSEAIAASLFEWLPLVVQGVEPYMSRESISKGAHWSTHLGKELESARFGIVVLTRDNLRSPWLHFEAGAIAKSVTEARLAPLIFELTESDVLHPLAQFQVTRFTAIDVLRLLKSINEAGASPLMPESRLGTLFDKFWPDLKSKVDHTLAGHRDQKTVTKRSSDDLLEEVLLLSREHANMLAHPERFFGRSVAAFVDDIINGYFATEASLADAERNTVRALLARWAPLSQRLATFLETNESIRSAALMRQLLQFQKYLDEARAAMDKKPTLDELLK